MRISTSQPMVYSQQVRDLQVRIDKVNAEIDNLPQEKVTLAAEVKHCAAQERKAHIFAGCSALVGIGGAALASHTPLGFALVGAGALGVFGAEWKAVDFSNAGHRAERGIENLPLKSMRLNEKLDFLADWQSSKRQSEWHQLHGYPKE